MDSVTLPPDLEQFAAAAIAAGRYRDMDDLLRTGINLVRRLEAERIEFIASLEAAEAEAEQVGSASLDEVLAEVDRIIGEAERRQG